MSPFDDIAQSRRAAMSAAATRIERVSAAGGKVVAEIEHQAHTVAATAAAEVANHHAEPTGGGWPAPDPPDRLLSGPSDLDDVGPGDLGRW